MATYIAVTDDNFFAQIFSGQGKSIIILMLAIYEIKHRDVANVLIVTCNKILSDSLSHDLSRMCPHDYKPLLKFSHSTSE